MLRLNDVDVLCFGNALVEEDRMAKSIASVLKLKGFTFIPCDSPEIIASYIDREFIILDVAQNIHEPILITDIDHLADPKMVSLHDFDLAFFLKLQERMSGKKRRVRIVAVPMRGDVQDLAAKTAVILKRMMKST